MQQAAEVQPEANMSILRLEQVDFIGFNRDLDMTESANRTDISVNSEEMEKFRRGVGQQGLDSCSRSVGERLLV